MANRRGKNGSGDILTAWAPKSLQMVTAAMNSKTLALSKEGYMTNLDSILKSKDITLPIKVRPVKAVVFQ